MLKSFPAASVDKDVVNKDRDEDTAIWVQAMATYTYELVEKNGSGFTPLRAIGLAVELAHKQAKKKGLGAITFEDVEQVRLSGDTLRVREAQTDRWRKAASAYLKLLPRDSAFTLDLFRAQRQLLFDLDLNAQ